MASHRFALVVVLSVVASASIALRQSVGQAPRPTKEHEVFKLDVGKWDATMQLYATPDAEPTVSQATQTNELVGGMFMPDGKGDYQKMLKIEYKWAK